MGHWISSTVSICVRGREIYVGMLKNAHMPKTFGWMAKKKTPPRPVTQQIVTLALRNQVRHSGASLPRSCCALNLGSLYWASTSRLFWSRALAPAFPRIKDFTKTRHYTRTPLPRWPAKPARSAGPNFYVVIDIGNLRSFRRVV